MRILTRDVTFEITHDEAKAYFIEKWNKYHPIIILNRIETCTIRIYGPDLKKKCLIELYMKFYYIDEEYREWCDDPDSHYTIRDRWEARLKRIERIKLAKKQKKLAKEKK